jgi:hypothetical protein
MSDPGPVRAQSDLSDVVELVLDKGVVVNADIVVTVGDTELLGVRVRAAIASFDTAAEYGLEFPAGTDRARLEQASGRPPVTTEDGLDRGSDPYISARPTPDSDESDDDSDATDTDGDSDTDTDGDSDTDTDTVEATPSGGDDDAD